MPFDLSHCHPTWHSILQNALAKLDPPYVAALENDQNWLPGWSNCLNAFSLPLPDLKAILFGESPYPRAESANGYAFWDGSVHEIWSENGLTKPVNRATSLRNFIKMLLVAEGALDPTNTSQPTIAALPTQGYVRTLNELFQHMLNKGILLLNASLVLSQRTLAQEAKQWRPFLLSLLTDLRQHKPHTELLFFGRIAGQLRDLPQIERFPKLTAEHPYNLTFIHNPTVLGYFRPLHLLIKNSRSKIL